MTTDKVDFNDSAWEAQSLRLTVFPCDAQAAMQTDYWRQVRGEDPESAQNKKIVKVAEGPYENCKLVLQVDLQRIQWAISPRVDADEVLEGLATLGSLPGALAKFEPVCSSWLEQCPAIERMAFGAVLLQRGEGHAACYAKVQEYLPNVTIAPSARDLNYRINYRRNSQTVEGLEINRLADWSVIRWVALLHVGHPQFAMKHFAPQDGYACKLELDVNTDAEHGGTLPRSLYQSLWKELVCLGREIAGKGDIP